MTKTKPAPEPEKSHVAMIAVGEVKSAMSYLADSVRGAIRALNETGPAGDDLARRLRKILSDWYGYAEELDDIEDETVRRGKVRQ